MIQISSVTLVALVLAPFSVAAEGNRELFAQQAIERFYDEGVPQDKLRPVMTALEAWLEGGKTEELWVEVSDAIDAAAHRKGVQSELTVGTTPNDKATIKCQTVGQRHRNEEPQTLGASEVSKKINVGHYYIWAERNGKPTSLKDRKYFIVQKVEEIELVEEEPSRSEGDGTG